MTNTCILEMKERLHNLEIENEKLQKEKKHLAETVEWMHDMIWDLIRRNKSMGAA